MVSRSVEVVLEEVSRDHVQAVNLRKEPLMSAHGSEENRRARTSTHEDGPKVHRDKADDPGSLVNGPQVRGGVVRYALKVAMGWVESVRSEGSGDHPAVVGLVQLLVEDGEVNGAMDVVDRDFGEPEGEGDRKHHVRSSLPPCLSAERSLGHGVVHLAVAWHVGEEPGNGREGEGTNSVKQMPNLPPNLILLNRGRSFPESRERSTGEPIE